MFLFRFVFWTEERAGKTVFSFLGVAAIKRLEIQGAFLSETLPSLPYGPWILICNPV